jgi:hypothetical protein
MALEIVWVHTDPTSPLGLAVGGENVVLPHCADNTSADPKRLAVTLDATTLVLGILVTSDHSRIMLGSRPTRDQLRSALRFVSAQVGAASEDELCVNAAANLNAQSDSRRAIRALRRAIELVPDATFCSADLIASLFQSLSDVDCDVDATLSDVLQTFLAWHKLDTSLCRNEEVALYCGFAAMAYFGHRDQLQTIARQHLGAGGHFPWLTEQMGRLLDVPPGSVERIRLVE